MRPRRILRAGAICRRIWIAAVHRQTGMLGPGGAVQCGEKRLDGRDWRMSEYRWNLYWLYHAGFSGQVHAVHEPAARFAFVFGRGTNLWTSDSRLAPVYAVVAQQRTRMAQAPALNVWVGHSCPTPLGLG